MTGKKKIFEIEGNFQDKNKNETRFKKIVEAENEARAKEINYCIFGSKHKIKRRWIKINGIKEVKVKIND